MSKKINPKLEIAYDAILHNNLSQFQEILSEIDINARIEHGSTLLIQAVLKNRFDMVRLLLQNQANSSLLDKNGWSAMHYCATFGYKSLIPILLSFGADINIQDSFGNTPLAKAVFESKGNPEMVNFLVSLGAYPHIENIKGVSAYKLSKKIANYPTSDFFKD